MQEITLNKKNKIYIKWRVYRLENEEKAFQHLMQRIGENPEVGSAA